MLKVEDVEDVACPIDDMKVHRSFVNFRSDNMVAVAWGKGVNEGFLIF